MKAWMLVLGMLLAGCVTSPVQPLDDGYNVITTQDWTTLSTGQVQTNRAMKQASAYCSSNGKVAVLKSSSETGITGITPLASTVVFKCVKTE